VLFFVLSFAVAGCASNENYIRPFLLEDGRQYFVSPSEFRGKQGRVTIDFTVRLKEEEENSVSANFTAPIVNDTRDVNDAALEVDGRGRFPLYDLSYLFVDNDTVRYESSMEYADLQELVEAVDEEEATVLLRLDHGGEERTYEAGERFYESMRRLSLRLE
jgi:hypothetical protein